MTWMIYGATGYTGQLVVEEALKRGHRPLLAGRNPDKLDVLAEQYDLDYVAFRLDDERTIAEAIADVDVVYHAAGPFIHTSDPMIRACLATNTHYIDITGEITVFENTYTYDDAARKVGVGLVSGAGFDVVPSDCIATYVANQVMGATHLETAIFALDGISQGTSKTAVESASVGLGMRRNGQLVPMGFAKYTQSLTLPDGKTRQVASFPWGDVSVSYRTTGIPNITSYLSIPPTIATVGRITYPIASQLMKIGAVRNLAKSLIERYVEGPDEQARQNGQSYIHARAWNNQGQSASAWLTTVEAYRYTAEIGVLAVESMLERNPIGALTPVQAFGVDFTLEIEGTTRIDV
ncbi:MAG: NAD(P)H-binding protein [Chloroflexota bacterium]